MQLYPFYSPIILNDERFSLNGGQGTGSFPQAVLQSAYLTAEIQATAYIGAPLLPVTVTGTYPFMHQSRISTDYGYVSQLLSVNIMTKQNCQDCSLTANEGCGYVYQDTFGYVDFHRTAVESAASLKDIGY